MEFSTFVNDTKLGDISACSPVSFNISDLSPTASSEDEITAAEAGPSAMSVVLGDTWKKAPEQTQALRDRQRDVACRETTDRMLLENFKLLEDTQGRLEELKMKLSKQSSQGKEVMEEELLLEPLDYAKKPEQETQQKKSGQKKSDQRKNGKKARKNSSTSSNSSNSSGLQSKKSSSSSSVIHDQPLPPHNLMSVMPEGDDGSAEDELDCGPAKFQLHKADTQPDFSFAVVNNRKEEVERSAASTSDLAVLRANKMPLDDQTKRNRLLGLRELSVEEQVQQRKEPVRSRGIVDPTDRKAREKSKAEKLYMLKKVSNCAVDSPDLLKMNALSPAAILGQVSRSTEGTVHSLSWPGDDSLSVPSLQQPQEEVSSVLSESSVMMEAPISAPSEPVSAPVNAVVEDSESMDEEMEMTALEPSIVNGYAGDRYSILIAAPSIEPKKEISVSEMMDTSLEEANEIYAKQQQFVQLDFVLSKSDLCGLFGEHLKRTGEESLLKLLDEMSEFFSTRDAKDRLALARAIFQQFLAESAIRENRIPLQVVSIELRGSTKKLVKSGQSSDSVYRPVEYAIKSYLARDRLPQFLQSALYKTLGRKKGKSQKRKTAIQDMKFSEVEEIYSGERAVKFKDEESDKVEKSTRVAFAEPAPSAAPQESEEDDDDVDDEEEEATTEATPEVRKTGFREQVKMEQAKPIASVGAAIAMIEKQQSKPVQLVTPVVEKTDKEDMSTGRSSGSHNLTTMDSILSDPEEMETFLSFAESNDRKVAQNAKTNFQFLQKVSQFNNAAEQERPKLARDIVESFFSPCPKSDLRRDQKGQVEVDVSELRKKQLVSRFRDQIEKAGSPQAKSKELQKGFFDKAVKDLESFMEPSIAKYTAAKKEGTIVVKKRAVPIKTAQMALKKPVVEEEKKKKSVNVPKGYTLKRAVECGGDILDAFAAYATDLGHSAPALFLQKLSVFKSEDDPVKRTAQAREIMDLFVSKTGSHSLRIPEHIRSGPEVRWNVFARKNLINAQFFDAIFDEVLKILDQDTWPRFVDEQSLNQCSGKEEKTVQQSVASIGQMEDSAFDLDMGATMHRNEIEEEVRRRLREDDFDEKDANDDDDEDTGCEDSPDVPATTRLVSKTSELKLSPSTAANLLTKLEDPAATAADTILVSKRQAAPPKAQSIFENKKTAVPAPAPTKAKKEAETKPVAEKKNTAEMLYILSGNFDNVHAGGSVDQHMTGVCPNRVGKMTYGEGINGKRTHNCFVVLKDRTLKVWDSEAKCNKGKDPMRTFSMSKLLRCSLVRNNSSSILHKSSKWTLRLYMDNMDAVVCLGNDSQLVLQDFEQALYDSAPHLGSNKTM